MTANKTISTVTTAAICTLMAFTAPASALEITLQTISTTFTNPIGIDYYEPTNEVLMSVNYPSGNPSNFVRVSQDGTQTAVSGISGLTDEVKIATARSTAKGGFSDGNDIAAGTAYSGTGVAGQILRINSDQTTALINTGGSGLFRGSLYVDRTGTWDGDLIGVTTSGQVWRIDENNNSSLVASINTHLEGMITVPNDPQVYGGLAGRIIAGAEGGQDMYAIDTSGNVTAFNDIGVAIEDIDLISGNENFFGVNFGTGALLGAEASQFANDVGKILLTQEFNGGPSGLFTMEWDFNSNGLKIDAVTLSGQSFVPGQWEHVTFASAGVVEIPPATVSAPSPILFLGLGLMGLGYARRKRSA